MAVRVKSGSPTNISPDIEECHSTKAKPAYSSCPSGITTINPNPGERFQALLESGPY